MEHEAEPTYRMILVDDEDEVRGRISSRISRETGFEVVGTAGNGYDALELIENHSPHVVLTDIQMPYIDGIELAGIIRREYPTVRIAFITGFNEFDYAREAIRLRVEDYLTKPLTENDIMNFLRDLRCRLDEEYRKTYSQEFIQRQYEESIPLLIDNCLTSLIISPRNQTREVSSQLQSLGLDLDSEEYFLCNVHVRRSSGHWDLVEFEKLKKSVLDIVQRQLGKEEYGFHSLAFQDAILILIRRSGSNFRELLDMSLYQLCRTIKHFLSVHIDISVSRGHRGAGELALAWQETRIAHDRGRMQNIGQLIYIDQLPDQDAEVAVLRQEEIDDFKHALRFGTREDVEKILSVIESRITDSDSAKNDMNLIVLGLTNSLIEYGEVIQTDLASLGGSDLIANLLKMNSFREFSGWILHMVDQLNDSARRARMDNGERLLQKAIDYMELHFDDRNLTMQKVCDAQSISVSYLSQLFKRYRSTTFVRELTDIRMKHAKEKLLLSGSRIIEVAEECGYRDVYYFSHCFKKAVGESPRSYRENHG